MAANDDSVRILRFPAPCGQQTLFPPVPTTAFASSVVPPFLPIDATMARWLRLVRDAGGLLEDDPVRPRRFRSFVRHLERLGLLVIERDARCWSVVLSPRGRATLENHDLAILLHVKGLEEP